MSDNPIRRLTLLVLFQAQQDKATESVIAPSARDGAPAIKYKVGADWLALSPPPAHLVSGIVTELATLACLSQGVFPTQGTIDVPFSGVRLKWVFRMPRSGAECVLTPFQ